MHYITLFLVFQRTAALTSAGLGPARCNVGFPLDLELALLADLDHGAQLLRHGALAVELETKAIQRLAKVSVL